VLFFKARPPPLSLCRHDDLRLRCLGQRQVVQRVGAVHLVRFAARLQPLCGVLADRLQHREARLLVLGPRYEQAVVHQGGQRLQGCSFRFGPADGLRRFQRKVADERGEASEHQPLALVEEVVAPGHGVAQRPLTLWQVACPARE